MLIFTPSITFKECVSLLHFCRLLYKYLNQIKNDTNEMSTYTIYANFLLQSLDDINATIREKRVKYNEAQGDVKERKLQTVTD